MPLHPILGPIPKPSLALDLSVIGPRLTAPAFCSISDLDLPHVFVSINWKGIFFPVVTEQKWTESCFRMSSFFPGLFPGGENLLSELMVSPNQSTAFHCRGRMATERGKASCGAALSSNPRLKIGPVRAGASKSSCRIPGNGKLSIIKLTPIKDLLAPLSRR